MNALTILDLDGTPTPGPRERVREVAEFFDWVWPSGQIYYGERPNLSDLRLPPWDEPRPRFRYLGPAWTPEVSA